VLLASASTAGATYELPLASLRLRCDAATLLESTLPPDSVTDGLIGQRRAAEALRFGLQIKDRGYNVYVAGLPGSGRTSSVRRFLERAAAIEPTPSDWCYIHNFRDPTRPRALQLAPGQGRRLRDDLRQLILTARREIPRAFESEEYIAQRESIGTELNRRREQGLGQLGAQAELAGFSLQVTPVGIALVPVMGNRPLSDEALAGLPQEMRDRIGRNRERLEEQVRAFLKEMRAAERQTRERLDTQDRDVALHAVGGLVDDLADDYADQPSVSEFLADVREGILVDIGLFRSHPLGADSSLPEPEMTEDPRHAGHERAFRKYEVNVVVENAAGSGAPVVLEANPSYPNLLGRIEREAVLGALVTDFTLIAPGALHRANGGYLVLRVEDLLRSPLAWEGLKRALREDAIQIEDIGEVLGLTSTRGLRPDPIPLQAKLVLIGPPTAYFLLSAYDQDFAELFKIRADFDTEMARTPENERAYAAYFGACASERGRPITRAGAALLIEEAARLVADQRKLSTRLGHLADLVREADHWAAEAGASELDSEHVRKAITQRRYRSALIQERMQELVARGVLLVRPEGAAVGQVNGLAVVGLGDVLFGRPSRITATVGAGRDGVLDIERQAELGGRIHSKGVLILSGYLTDRFARDKPLSLSARLVFEQSYEEVEGDSASLAELVALLSRLADAPLRQDLAMTGSINQHGEVQAIGGVNEKIEGFFDICVACGLTGSQGVIIPTANSQHLMLREDVLEAVEAGRFRVYAVSTVDQALELLTGLPSEQILQHVDAGLRRLAEALREFSAPALSGEMRGAHRRRDGKH
jgi:lon-related putative ATP-dependent protease